MKKIIELHDYEHPDNLIVRITYFPDFKQWRDEEKYPSFGPYLDKKIKEAEYSNHPKENPCPVYISNIKFFSHDNAEGNLNLNASQSQKLADAIMEILNEGAMVSWLDIFEHICDA